MLQDGRLPGRTARHFTLQWHLTNECGESCRHCYDRSTLPALDLGRARAVLQGLRAFCSARGVTGGVSFTGGDPFRYPHFFEVYRAAVDAGLEVSVLGNVAGDDTLRALVELRRPRYYQVSLEGCEAINDSLRGGGHYARVMEFLERLRAHRVRAHVMLTLHRANLGEAEGLARVLDGKVHRFLFNRLAQVGAGRALEQPTREEYVGFLRRWLLLAKRYRFVGLKDNLLNIPLHHFGRPLAGGCTGAGCGAAFNFLALLPNGDVHACRKLPSPLGNVLEQSLDALWDSERAARYRVGSRACTLCPIRNRCGGCLAVGWGMGSDPLEALDPHCFFSERHERIARAARSTAARELLEHVGDDDGRRSVAVDSHAEPLVERTPLLQLRRDRGARVRFEQIRAVTALRGQGSEARDEHGRGDVQEEHVGPVTQQAAGGLGQDAAGARGDDRGALRQAFPQERALGRAVSEHAVGSNEAWDRADTLLDDRIHVEVSSTQALRQEGTDGRLSRAGVADQDDVSGHRVERAHDLRLLRSPGPAPPLVVLELTRRCGRQCEVCFHRDMRGSSLARADMPLALARRAIRSAAEAGSRRIRLTGGEPLRHPSFAALLLEIRSTGLEAWVNTAGLPEGGTPWQLLGELAHDVLLPLRSRRERAEIVEGVAAIRRGGAARVRLGVVLTREHVEELPQMIGLARELDCPLEAYRVMSVPGHPSDGEAAELCQALSVLERENRFFPPSSRVRVANAVPFCVSEDRRLAASACFGACFDDGRDRLVISPEGEIRPSYSLRLPLGTISETSISAAWRHPALLGLHDAASLPKPCRSCPELRSCCGGSRHEARMATGDLQAMDPLAIHGERLALA